MNTTRRAFAGALGAVAVAPALAAQSTSAAGDIRLGVASYSLRMFQRALAIRMIAKLGIRYVTIKEFHLPYRSSPKELAAGAAEFRKAGIEILGGGVVYMTNDDAAEIRSYFDYARNAGMPMMMIGATRKTLPRIQNFVKEYGIAVAVHNHGPEDKEFPTPEAALDALNGMDARMGVCVDVGHTTRAGGDPVASIRRAGARLFDVHIKDLKDVRDGATQVPVGDGAMPVVEIFRELKRQGYRRAVHLEYEIDADDPLPGMMKSFAYMRGVLAALRG